MIPDHTRITSSLVLHIIIGSLMTLSILQTVPESHLKLFSIILHGFLLQFLLFCIDGEDNKMENKQGARIQMVFPYCSPEQ